MSLGPRSGCRKSPGWASFIIEPGRGFIRLVFTIWGLWSPHPLEQSQGPDLLQSSFSGFRHSLFSDLGCKGFGRGRRRNRGKPKEGKECRTEKIRFSPGSIRLLTFSSSGRRSPCLDRGVWMRGFKYHHRKEDRGIVTPEFLSILQTELVIRFFRS